MLRSLRRQIAPAGRVRTTNLALTSDAHPKQSAYRTGGPASLTQRIFQEGDT